MRIREIRFIKKGNKIIIKKGNKRSIKIRKIPVRKTDLKRTRKKSRRKIRINKRIKVYVLGLFKNKRKISPPETRKTIIPKLKKLGSRFKLKYKIIITKEMLIKNRLGKKLPQLRIKNSYPNHILPITPRKKKEKKKPKNSR